MNVKRMSLELLEIAKMDYVSYITHENVRRKL